MDKRVVFAVAGSGKTGLIVDQLDLEKKSLIVTYTVDNALNLEDRILDKFGCMPPNTHLMTYFSFLHSFCYLPFLADAFQTNGICWEQPPFNKYGPKKTNEKHYITKNRYLYHNRIAKLIMHLQKDADVLQRLNKYFDQLLVDEVQDFAAYDFEFLTKLCASELDITLVGDFYQHTFDTSRDGVYKKNLHKDYEKYLSIFDSLGLIKDTTSLIKSHRCAPEVCAYITEKLGIDIESHRLDSVQIEHITNKSKALELARDDNVVKLFYNNASKYSCRAKNWGKSKGEDHYNDVCVVLNPGTEKALRKDGVIEIAEGTKGKLYVACTRARGNLYFVSQSHLKELIL